MYKVNKKNKNNIKGGRMDKYFLYICLYKKL